MLNKKGTTLAEVIISIALISVVLVFMIRLLINLNNMQTNTTYATGNQVNRAEILRMIGNDLNNKDIASITDNSDANNLNITFGFTDGTRASISTTSEIFTYTSSDNTLRRWIIEDGSIYVNRAKVYYSADSKAENNKIYTLIIDIEVHTINEENDVENNNRLDDIIISYMGSVEDFSTPLSCLGQGC